MFSFRYFMNLLVNPRAVNFVYPVHEVPTYNATLAREHGLGDVQYLQWTHDLDGVHVRRHIDGVRSRDGGTAARDTEIIRKYLSDTDATDMRMLYFLAQSYKDIDNVTGAIYYYRERAKYVDKANSGVDGTRWYSVFRVGLLLIDIDKELIAADPRVDSVEAVRRYDEVTGVMLSAHELDPTRAEPYFWLAKFFMTRADAYNNVRYRTAYALLSVVVDLPVPPVTSFYVEDSIYIWHMRLEMAVAAARSGKPLVAMELNDELLDDYVLPHGGTLSLVRSNRDKTYKSVR